MYTIKLLLDKIQCTVMVKAPYVPLQKWAVSRHVNMQHELHVALCGHCRIDVDGTHHTLNCGEAMLVPQNTFHASVEASDDFSHLVIAFLLHENNQSIPLKNQKLTLKPEDIDLCRLLTEELRCEGRFWRQRVFALYSLLLTSLLDDLSLFSHRPDHPKADPADNRFFIIDDFFEADLNSITEQKLSQRLHVSCRQLNRILKENYGTCFRQKLHNTKMDRARWLLQTTDMTVTQICETIGYTEPAFYKAFKAHFGLPPGQYRSRES